MEIFHSKNVFYTVQHIDILPLRFKEKKTVQYFLNAFYTKTRLSQGLLPDAELLKIMFSAIMENANRVKNFFSI